MKLVNLTPHVINIFDEAGEEVVAIPPSGEVARVEMIDVFEKKIGDIDLYTTRIGEVIDLPDPQPNTLYIVSSLVEAMANGRDDLVAPGNLLRGRDGQPIGCRGLKRSEK